MVGFIAQAMTGVSATEVLAICAFALFPIASIAYWSRYSSLSPEQRQAEWKDVD